jgi:hypothetical protein
MKINSVKGNFLNEEQKKLKQQIMEQLFAALFDNVHKNIGGILDQQSGTDALISCLIMFARESIVHFIRNSNMNNTLENRKHLANEILDVIKQDIMEKLCDA